MSETIPAATVDGGTPAAPAATPAALPPSTPQIPEGNAKPASVVPEKYEFKPPEGYTFDGPLLESLTAFAKSKGLTQDAAQDYANFIVEQDRTRETAKSEAWESKQESWINSIKADKELGGQNFDRTKANVNRVWSKVDSAVAQEAKEIFEVSGLGNHPAFVKLFNFLGQHMEDDSIDAGGTGSGPSGDLAKRMNFNFGIGPK